MNGPRRAALATLAIGLAVEGDILLAQALRSMPAGSPWVYLPLCLAIGLLVGHFALWYYLLARSELSVLMPMTGLYYVFNALLAHWQLGEFLSARTWSGTMLIAAGVLLVTTSIRRPQKGLDSVR